MDWIPPEQLQTRALQHLNIFFLTQSGSIDLFFQLMKSLKQYTSIGNTGFYVTDACHYSKFRKSNPDIDTCPILKEWEIIEAAHRTKLNEPLLKKYEERFGRPFLWNALVADRRIYFGKKYAYNQDYTPFFSHRQMLTLLQEAIKQLLQLFDDLQPDAVISFQCATLGDYLSFLISQERNIPFLNLRPTRILNYFYAGEDIWEPSNFLENQYKKALQEGLDPALVEKVKKYLSHVRENTAMYEGVVPVSNKPPVSTPKKLKKMNFLKRIGNHVRDEYHYRFGKYRYDNHATGTLLPLIAQRIKRPWRARWIHLALKKHYVSRENLKNLSYAFFPLHTEPEVTLLVYSKPYLNQIEAVRLVSHNLPVGMKLVVKEHPWSIGKRPLSYYKKLLRIPNVILADPSLTSRELTQQASLVTVIAGSVGLEGLMLKKPVISLGRTPYNFLPSCMIRNVTQPENLGEKIKDLLATYEHDEKALESYVGSVMKHSVPVNFYTELLERSAAYKPSDINPQGNEKEKQINLLAQYLLKVARTRCQHKNQIQIMMSVSAAQI